MRNIYKILTSIFLISMLVTITTVITTGTVDAVPVDAWNRTFNSGIDAAGFFPTIDFTQLLEKITENDMHLRLKDVWKPL